MFAYCNNNPVNALDAHGKYPVSVMSDYSDDILEYRDWLAQRPQKAKEMKIKKTVRSLFKNFEVSAGIGQGIYAEFDLFEIGVGLGMYGNYGTINYSNGKFYTGQELFVGATSSLLGQEIGFAEHSFRRTGEANYNTNSWSWINSKQESFTLFSVACYPLFFGASISIGYNLNSLLSDLSEIYS